jgi:hypothetical protein
MALRQGFNALARSVAGKGLPQRGGGGGPIKYAPEVDKPVGTALINQFRHQTGVLGFLCGLECGAAAAGGALRDADAARFRAAQGCCARCCCFAGPPVLASCGVAGNTPSSNLADPEHPARRCNCGTSCGGMTGWRTRSRCSTASASRRCSPRCVRFWGSWRSGSPLAADDDGWLCCRACVPEAGSCCQALTFTAPAPTDRAKPRRCAHPPLPTTHNTNKTPAGPERVPARGGHGHNGRQRLRRQGGLERGQGDLRESGVWRGRGAVGRWHAVAALGVPFDPRSRVRSTFWCEIPCHRNSHLLHRSTSCPLELTRFPHPRPNHHRHTSSLTQVPPQYPPEVMEVYTSRAKLQS